MSEPNYSQGFEVVLDSPRPGLSYKRPFAPKQCKCGNDSFRELVMVGPEPHQGWICSRCGKKHP